MDKIRFLSNESVIDTNIKRISEHVIEVCFAENIPNDSVLLGGFELINEYNGYNMSGNTYHDYNTMYRMIDDNTVQLSNDESVYVEPIPTQPATPDSEPELTDEEKAAIALKEFNSAKSSKIYEMSNACQKAIENGVDVEGKHYSYTLQDQSNMLNVMSMAKQSNMEVPYHADGESCSLYTYKQICTVYMAESINLTMQQTYFNQLKLYIQSLTDISDKETVDAIYYGIPLTGQYLEEYNNIIAQSNAIMTAITSVEE